MSGPFVSNIGGGSGGASRNKSTLLKHFGKTETVTSLATLTFRSRMLIKEKPFAIRFRFINNTALDITNCIANFAFSTNKNTPTIPVGGAWTNIKFSGANTFTLVSSGTAGKNQVTASDVMLVDPLTRTDGEGYIIDIGIWQGASTNNVQAYGRYNNPAGATLEQGLLQGGAYTGDCVTTPGNFVYSFTEYYAAVELEIFTVESLTRDTLLCCGDSIMQGVGMVVLNPQQNQYGASKQVANALGLNLIMACEEGTTPSIYTTNGVDKLSIGKPKFAYYAPFSPNDLAASWSLATFQANTLTWLKACSDVGAKPIIALPSAKTGVTTGQEATRRSMCIWARDYLTRQGIAYVDRDALWSDNSTSAAAWNSSYTADNLHPNAAGYALEVTNLSAIISAS